MQDCCQDVTVSQRMLEVLSNLDDVTLTIWGLTNNP